MPKGKTHKATRKRIKISQKKKIIVRSAGQDHFNARESSTTTVRKRRDRTLDRTNMRGIRSMVPHFRHS
ncbi:MAG: 50S ribosomal protein L35 [bacterium]